MIEKAYRRSFFSDAFDTRTYYTRKTRGPPNGAKTIKNKNIFMIITAEASIRTRNETVHVCSGSVIGKRGSPSLSALLRGHNTIWRFRC